VGKGRKIKAENKSMAKNEWQKDKTVGKRRMRWQKYGWQKNEEPGFIGKKMSGKKMEHGELNHG